MIDWRQLSNTVSFLEEEGFATQLLMLLHPLILNLSKIDKLTSYCRNELFARNFEISNYFTGMVSPKVVASPISPSVSYNLYHSGNFFKQSLEVPYELGQNYFNHLSWSIDLPRLASLLTDSGKIQAFDNLLTKLKPHGHRCLVYSQMTKMLDILSDYMILRGHSFVRFDGSSSTDERRDLVHKFQNDSSIFCFLLSTRAGGIGINLTAADTVIFYDSDWNPTNDLQAMDRAHRLGQTRQVTVYRLVTRNTIEERILERAQIKDRITSLVLTRDQKLSSQAAKELLEEENLAEQEVTGVGEKRTMSAESDFKRVRVE
ncbi:hypothetical protein GEMRC1_008176 [Eukaryota sp. GEM-RC1]